VFNKNINIIRPALSCILDVPAPKRGEVVRQIREALTAKVRLKAIDDVSVETEIIKEGSSRSSCYTGNGEN